MKYSRFCYNQLGLGLGLGLGGGLGLGLQHLENNSVRLFRRFWDFDLIICNFSSVQRLQRFFPLFSFCSRDAVIEANSGRGILSARRSRQQAKRESN